MHVVCRLDTAQEQPEPELFKETKLNVDCSLSEFVTEQVHWSQQHESMSVAASWQKACLANTPCNQKVVSLRMQCVQILSEEMVSRARATLF